MRTPAIGLLTDHLLTTHSSGRELLTTDHRVVRILLFQRSLTKVSVAMEILIPADRIQERVSELAREIGERFQGRPVTILGVLTGSLMFLADLVRRLDLPLRIGLIQASSYRGRSTESGLLHVQPELFPDVRDRHILLLDDILDTGKTLAYLVRHLRSLSPASLEVAVLLRKQGRQIVPLEPDYCGFTIPNAFVVGYGLDYNDEYRNLPYIAVLPDEGPHLTESLFRAGPDAR